VHGADIVVLATPIQALPAVMDAIAPHLSPHTVVTDVASTKAQVMRWAAEHLPGVTFIGGHPMAGGEKTGLDAATPDLFQGATYCIVAPLGAPASALEMVKGMAMAVGAAPLMIEAVEHDYLVAGISHLPLLVAAALVQAVAGDSAWPAMRRLASTGFRDTSRLASGSTEMGRDMCLTNKDVILAWLERFRHELERLRGAIEEGDKTLEEALVQARASREIWLEEKGW
jgi:prephenate dehydrogenase